MTKSGEAALVVWDEQEEGAGPERIVYWISRRVDPDATAAAFLGACAPAAEGGSAAAARDACARARLAKLRADAELAELIGGHDLSPCELAIAAEEEAVVSPRGRAGKVRGSRPEIRVSVGDRSGQVLEWASDLMGLEEGVDFRDPELLAAAWSVEHGQVFVLAREYDPFDDNRTGGDVNGYGVPSELLGLRACTPLPPLEEMAKPSPPPRLDVAKLTRQDVCLAMTKDGKSALFVELSQQGSGPDRPTHRYVWRGSDAPAFDPSPALSAPKADAAELAKLQQAADGLGLTACPDTARNTVHINGHRFTFKEIGDNLWLIGSGDAATRHERAFQELEWSDTVGGGRETFDGVVQHPSGGPFFIIIGNGTVGVAEARKATEYDLAALGFCGADGEQPR